MQVTACSLALKERIVHNMRKHCTNMVYTSRWHREHTYWQGAECGHRNALGLDDEQGVSSFLQRITAHASVNLLVMPVA